MSAAPTLDEQVAMVADCVNGGLTTIIRGTAMLHAATGLERELLLTLLCQARARRARGAPAERAPRGDDGSWW
jgi:hypothetical protein